MITTPTPKASTNKFLDFSSRWLNVFWISRHKRTQTTTRTQLQKTVKIQNVNTDQIFKKPASKDQIRILAHEKKNKKKQGITSSNKQLK